jgi:hypothetical protein
MQRSADGEGLWQFLSARFAPGDWRICQSHILRLDVGARDDSSGLLLADGPNCSIVFDDFNTSDLGDIRLQMSAIIMRRIV